MTAETWELTGSTHSGSLTCWIILSLSRMRSHRMDIIEREFAHLPQLKHSMKRLLTQLGKGSRLVCTAPHEGARDQLQVRAPHGSHGQSG